MAFHASAGLQLQNLVTASSELISSKLSTPWRTGSAKIQLSRPQANTAAPSTPERTRSIHTEASSRPSLPECLHSVPMSALRLQPISHASSLIQPTMAGILSSVSGNALSRCNPLARRLPSPHNMARQYSTLHKLGLHALRPIPPLGGLTSPMQRRTVYANNTSFNLLSHMEQTANNNPGSASSQNAFYAALLRAGRGDLVIQRYESGRYASNPACEALYIRALERARTAEDNVAGSSVSTAQNSGISGTQMQAIGQAVAAKASDKNAAFASAGSGAKNSPLYVIVDESRGSALFKWAKFLLWFAFVVWSFYVVVTLVVEAGGMLKRVGGQTHAEAKPELQKTRFSDVHGCDEAKEELLELVEFLKAPDKFSALGGKLPKGVLLTGPPGTGKTLLARAVAGEAGVPFFYMSGSEFDEIYVGVGAKRVRELFIAARNKAPAIVFIDELDAIGGKRNQRDAAYVKQTLNQLLTELDGFDTSKGVVFIAATNFPQLLDKALTRPGRFDRNISVPLPDVRGRVAILKHHTRNMRLGTDVDAAVIARGTPGFSGAELENLVNQAAVFASKSKAQKIDMSHLEWAKDRILMGAERRSAVIQQKDKVMTAYHEGGHALVAMLAPHADPLYKATIMPRGHALGITFQLPALDKVSMAKNEMLAKIDVCMGGKVAEELVYGPEGVTSGAQSDLQQATAIAYRMVAMYGMSETLGNVDFNSGYNRLPPETHNEIWREVRRILDESKQRTTKLLTEKRKELDLLARALVEYENLNKDEMEAVVRGERLPNKIKANENIPIKIPEIPLPPGFGGGGMGVPGGGGSASGNGGEGVSVPTPGSPGQGGPQRPHAAGGP